MGGLGGRYATERRLWFTLGALGIVFVWFMIGSIVGPYSGKLSQAQKNDNASFLPASAESTIVNDLQAGFSDVASVPILIVFSSETPLTPAQYAQIAAYGNTISSLPLSESPLTVGDYIVAGPIVPIPSSDGKAALLSVTIPDVRSLRLLDAIRLPWPDTAIGGLAEGGFVKTQSNTRAAAACE